MGSDRTALTHTVARWKERLRDNPGDPEAVYELGVAYCELGLPRDGLPLLQQAAKQAPHNVEALGALAECFVNVHAPDKALAVYKQALKLSPDSTPMLFRVAVLSSGLGKIDSAIALYERVVKLEPRNPSAQSNLGIALTRVGRTGEAIRRLRGAISLNPTKAIYHYNLGKALEETLDLTGAEQADREAIRLDPEFPEASWSLAQLRWLQGDLQGAWRYYERRLFRRGFQRRPEIFSKRAWQGEPFPDKTLLTYAEQGHGDSIQFVRYVDQAKARGGRVIVECQPNLVRLFQSLEHVDQVFGRGDPLPPFDLQCSIMSFPVIFGTESMTIPAHIPYLFARPEDAIELPGDPKASKVGLVWAGNPHNQPVDSRRSFDVREYAPLLDIPGVTFYSLQVGVAGLQLRKFPAGRSIVDLGPKLKDFAHTAAVIDQLDLIISADTAIPHLFAALGRETWIVLGAFPDFRWFLKGNESPWYPTVRLFRARERGGWRQPIDEIREALSKRVSEQAVGSAGS